MANPAPGFTQHPSYQVSIEPRDERVQVYASDLCLVDTTQAIQVLETRHQPVWYVPLTEVAPELIVATDTSTYCPFKGQASYWSVQTSQLTLVDVMWSYRDPYDECAPIRDFVAFYTDKVSLSVEGMS